MTLKNWVRGVFGRKTATIVTRTPRARIGLETLDDRLAPAVLTVNSLADTASSEDGYLSLRQAIAIVNSPTLPGDLSVEILGQISGTLHAGGTDTIVFDPSAVTAPIVLSSGALTLSISSATSLVTIDGGTNITVNANNLSRVFDVTAGAGVTLARLTITGGNADNPPIGVGGGGVRNAGTLTVVESVITGNHANSGMLAGGGGGIGNTGVLRVINSTFSSNASDINVYGGGAIYNSNGDMLVVGSTFTGNTAAGGGNGGAITWNFGTNVIVSSTFSGNSSMNGGAIMAQNGVGVVAGSTVTGNSATNLGEGIYTFGTMTLVNSIVAGNELGGDVYGSLFLGSHNNLIGDGTNSNAVHGVDGNLVGSTVIPINPLLGPLADNGGPTHTFSLLAGSPAINAGGALTTLDGPVADAVTTTVAVNNALVLGVVPNYTVLLVGTEQMLVTAASGSTLTVTRGFNGTTAAAHPSGDPVSLATDQRGEPRMTSGVTDIGSFESTPPFSVTSPAAPQTVNAASVLVEGTADADSLVQVYSDANNNGIIDGADAVVASQQLTGGATTYSITVSLTQDAVNNFLVTATPPLGSESDPIDVPTVTEDSTAPNAPVVTGPAAAVSVNAPTYTVTGTAEADSLVTVYVDVDSSGTYTLGDTVAGSQQLTGGATAYSIVVPLTQDAVNRFVVTSTDAAANESAAAVVPLITEDSTAPAAPVVTGPATAVAVNAPTYTVTGTAEADSLVTVYVDVDSSGTYTLGDTVAGSQQLTGGATAYSIVVPLTQDAVNRFVVTSTDAAANESAATVVPLITEDSIAPTALLVLFPVIPFTVDAPNVAILGTAEANSLVTVYVDVDSSGTFTVGDTVAGTQQLTGGVVTYSITVPLTQDAVNRFLVTSTDAAGNESAAAVAPLITEDSTAPAVPTVTAPVNAVSVNAETYTVTGTAEANSLVTVYIDVDSSGTLTVGDTVAGLHQLTDGATAYSVSVSLTQDAVNRFLVTSADAATNESVVAVVPAITEDSTAPAAPVVASPEAVAVVNAATVTVTGTAEADSLVTVYVDVDSSGTFTAGDTVVGTQQLTGGATAYSITVDLAQDAVNRFLVTSTDAAGNESAAAAVPVVVEDSTAPATPVVETPAAAAVVKSATATVAGTVELDTLVTVYADVNGNGVVDAGDTVVGTQQLTGEATVYSVTVPLTRNAVNRFLVTSTDAAANESAAAVVPVVTEISTPPAAPVVTGPAARVSTVAATAVLTGTAPAGSLVTAYRDVNGNGVVDAGDTIAGAQQLAGDATAYSITVTLTPNAVNLFLVTAADAVGQVSAATAVPNIVQGEPNPGVPLAFSAGADVGGGVAQLFNPDGTVRLTVEPFPGTPGGVRVATADVTGDGIPDLIAGTGPGTRTQVKVYDGATGAVLLQVTPFEASFTAGVYVEAADLDGDGRAELIVTPDQGGGPRVQIFDGATGAVRQNFFGIDDPDFRGGARASTSDVNGDGVADLIVAAGFGGGPRVSIYDGAALRDGTVRQIANFFVFENTLRNGVYITAGDIDGDGFADVIAGGGPGGGPRVYAISGKALLETGAQVPVANFFSGDINSRAGVRVATADLDLDGRADLIVGSGQGDGSQVTVYLGKDVQPTGTPPATNDFDAFADLNASSLFAGGVFVG
jgi:hypothetical protein